MREPSKRWIAQYISIDGEGEFLVLDPRGLIKKVNLKFEAKCI